MQKACKNCQAQFEVTDSDKLFYKKIKVSEPTHCPDCRHQRRLAFRNERHLFKRKCDFCKEDIISFFNNNVPFPVYCNDCWWSDKWDPMEYGQDFDFKRPFFPQFQELMMKVPKVGVLQLNNDNCEYNSLLAYSKNTYMSPGSYFLEDCYYARKSQYSKDCLNSNFLDHCELVSDSINCKKCYDGHHLINCRNCSSCWYLVDCSNCQDCFMCSGINNKKYHYKNKEYSKREYQMIVEEQSQSNSDDLMKEFNEFNKTIPKKYQNQIQCDNSSGDYIQNCKNAFECYDCFDIEDSKFISESVSVKDSMDLNSHDKDIELCYEVCSGGESNYNLRFAFCSIASSDSYYLYSCFYLPESFGCDGIHVRQKNCILNKKYSKEGYEKLKDQIIEHMKGTGEFGEFFPISLSLYPYNYTLAYDYYPITKEEALQKGYKWADKDLKQYQPATFTLPVSIKDVPDTIVDEVLACADCGKNYRIIEQELKLSRKLNQPLSLLCPDCRQLRLLSLKNPHKLWNRKCDKCSKDIQSTYSQDRPEMVYCESCYLKEVY